MVTSPHIVYALIDPESYDIRYVGKSSSMFRRPNQPHSAHCGSWIKSLKQKGLKPIVKVLGFYNDHDECIEDEIRWIAKFREMGFDLTNIMDGGEGVTPGYKQPREVVEKRAAKLRNRKRAPEIGLKISAALKGRNDVKLICLQCKRSFVVIRSRSFKKFCNRSCDALFRKGKRPPYQLQNKTVKNGY